MKSLMVLLWLFCYTIVAKAQDENEYRETDRTALNIPDAQTVTTEGIASYITKNFDADDKKVRAIYVWVAANIKYDSDSLHRIILNEDREKLITTALKRRRGVCENFASIFNDICAKIGLRSFVIEGYTRQNGSVDRSTHAWCAAFIDKKWVLYDPTWDADNISRGRYSEPLRTNYFQITPSDFIHSHMPFDPMFQFLDYPISYKDFNRGNIQMNTRSSYFNYIDSINLYEKLDPLHKYLGAVSRIEKNGTPDAKVNTKLSQLKMEIEIIYQDKDSVMYNGAIADYNAAINLFNGFITYRNNDFKPSKTGPEVQAIFDTIEKRISSAHSKLDEVNQSKAILTLNARGVENALDTLSAHFKEQKVFLKNNKSPAK